MVGEQVSWGAKSVATVKGMQVQFRSDIFGKRLRVCVKRLEQQVIRQTGCGRMTATVNNFQLPFILVHIKKTSS